MIYIISDIHGCYREFLELLELIEFSSQDELYILGDMIDRGPEPVHLLQDLMLRPNVYPILGNHEYMALSVLRKLNVEITEENFESHLSEDDFLDYIYWMRDGGDTTINQFVKLSGEQKEEVLEYLEECSLYEEIHMDGERYILVHADIYGYEEGRPLDTYAPTDLIFHRADYRRNYFQNEHTFLVTGHTPTFGIRADKKPLVYAECGHIAIDCGCVFGGKLAAYRLNDHKVFYVDRKE